MRIPIHEKNAERWEEKKPLWLILPFLMWQWILSTPMQGLDITSQGRSLYLQAHSKPEHIVGICSSWHKQCRGVSGARLFPRSGDHTSNRTPNTFEAPEQHHAHGSRAKQTPGKQGRALCQPIHTTNLQTTFSNTCGNKEEQIPGYKSNKLYSPIRKTTLYLISRFYQVTSYRTISKRYSGLCGK